MSSASRASAARPGGADESRHAPRQLPLDAVEIVNERAVRFGRLTALCIQEGGEWRELTYAGLSRRARALAADLVRAGVAPGDRVAILSESRPEWGIAFFAIVRAGGTIVPLDPKLAEGDLAAILADCTPRVLLASPSSMTLARKLQELAPSITVVAELGLSAAGAHSSSADSGADEPWAGRRPSLGSTAAIVYTSGTTGAPKGVMITYANLIFETLALQEVIDVGPGDSLLSILPLHHLLELTGGFLGVLNRGGTICYAASLFPQDILRLIAERRIKAMIGVPLFFRSLKSGLEREIRRSSLGARVAFRAAWLAAGVMRARRLRRVLFRPVHRRLGGRLELFISGGAPLELEIGRFFDRIGLPILQGYGLSEASPVVSVNTLAAHRLGSVGRPLAGVEVRIDRSRRTSEPDDGDVDRPRSINADGEILTRGPHVMKGYFHSEELTRETIDAEGWLHTGDIGRIDAGGFLYVTGRLSQRIVLGSGKKVHPEEVERILGRSPLIREVCVLGLPPGGRPDAGGEEVCAVVVPSLDPAQGARRSKDAPGDADRWVKDEVARAARELAPYKRPSRIIVVEGELPKTPSGKLKRSIIRRMIPRDG